MQKKKLDWQINRFYLSSILFEKYGDYEKAKYFLSKSANKSEDLPKELTKNREAGFKWKKEGNLVKAKEEFTLGAEAGDPISQYELAKLLPLGKENYEDLLKLAAPNLMQAQILLYRFLLEAHQYDKAYYWLDIILIDSKGLKIEGVPEVSTDFRPFYYTRSNKLPRLGDLLYKIAADLENKAEQIHLYHLGASAAHAKSIIALTKYRDDMDIRELIEAGKRGDDSATYKLIQLSSEGDSDTLIALLEQAKEGTDYYSDIVAKASKYHTLAYFTLGQIYLKERGPGDAHAIKIITQSVPTIEHFANEGNTLAQCYMGLISEEMRVDYAASVKWYGKAALGGNLLALYSLGKIYTNGLFEGIRFSETDPEQGMVCYIKCAELGYAPAQAELGRLSLERGNYKEAINWFEKSMTRGDIPKDSLLEWFHRDGDKEAKRAVLTLAKSLIENKKSHSEAIEWAKKILKSSQEMLQGIYVQEKINPQKEDNSSQQTPLVQQNALQVEEGQKIDEDDSEKTKESSHNKQTFSLTSIIYDNPQALAEAQVSALMNFVGKNISTPETQMRPQNHEKGVRVFNEELRLSIHVNKPSFAKVPPLVTFTQAAFLDEKLVSQAEYFSQTGLVFAALREAAEVGTVHMFGELLPAEEELILDSALDWSVFSHLPWQWDHSEDFSIVL